MSYFRLVIQENVNLSRWLKCGKVLAWRGLSLNISLICGSGDRGVPLDGTLCTEGTRPLEEKTCNCRYRSDPCHIVIIERISYIHILIFTGGSDLFPCTISQPPLRPI